MKKYISCLVAVTLSMASTSAFSAQSNTMEEITTMTDAAILQAKSIGQQIKILDTRKEVTEAFMVDRNNAILLDTATKAAKAAGTGMSVALASAIVGGGVAWPIGAVLVSVSNTANSRVAQITLRTAAGALLVIPVASFWIGSFYAGYKAAETHNETTRAKQIAKLKAMKTDAEILQEYETILVEAKSLVAPNK